MLLSVLRSSLSFYFGQHGNLVILMGADVLLSPGCFTPSLKVQFYVCNPDPVPCTKDGGLLLLMMIVVIV
jgi:hypothetical protein